jgi:tRNA U34 5-carboxymethylaminomethyl modifying GTPase MnmE/TrmE
MLLRVAYQNISDIEQQHVDEEILERIFSRFCIGK